MIFPCLVRSMAARAGSETWVDAVAGHSYESDLDAKPQKSGEP